MKTNKALKRLAKIEALMSDVMDRYSASAPHIREVLQDAKAAVTRAKEAVSLQASSGTTSAPKKAATKKAAVKVPPAKAVKKHGTTKQDYEG
jgi:acyl-coenzyme A synthetase/AMP-(fatty) acid ligase